MTTYAGRVVFLDQSSNMGGFWAFMADNNFNPYPRNTYILHDGDVLSILDDDNATALWSGTISLQAVPLMTQGVAGHWVRNTQDGVDLRTWYNWFELERRASLVSSGQVIEFFSST